MPSQWQVTNKLSTQLLKLSQKNGWDTQSIQLPCLVWISKLWPPLFQSEREIQRFVCLCKLKSTPVKIWTLAKSTLTPVKIVQWYHSDFNLFFEINHLSLNCKKRSPSQIIAFDFCERPLSAWYLENKLKQDKTFLRECWKAFECSGERSEKGWGTVREKRRTHVTRSL